jgi:hypothetical protein
MALWTVINVVLDCALVVGMVGLLAWSVLTQHRDPGCEGLRLRFRGRRLQIRVRLVALDAAPELADSPLAVPNAQFTAQ